MTLLCLVIYGHFPFPDHATSSTSSPTAVCPHERTTTTQASKTTHPQASLRNSNPRSITPHASPTLFVRLVLHTAMLSMVSSKHPKAT